MFLSFDVLVFVIGVKNVGKVMVEELGVRGMVE